MNLIESGLLLMMSSVNQEMSNNTNKESCSLEVNIKGKRLNHLTKRQ